MAAHLGRASPRKWLCSKTCWPAAAHEPALLRLSAVIAFRATPFVQERASCGAVGCDCASCGNVGWECASCGGNRLGMRFVRHSSSRIAFRAGASAGNALRVGRQRSRNAIPTEGLARNANPAKIRRTKRESDRESPTKCNSGRGTRYPGQRDHGKGRWNTGTKEQNHQPAGSEPAFVPVTRTLLHHISRCVLLVPQHRGR